MTTDTLPPGVGLRLLGGKSQGWAEGYRQGWEEYGVEAQPRKIPIFAIPGKFNTFTTDTGALEIDLVTYDREDYIEGYEEGWIARERSNDDN